MLKRELISISKLNKRQKAFADNFIKTGIAYRSAMDAGYSKTYASTNSHLMLENTRIKAYISKRLDKVDQKEIIDQQEVLRLLSEIASGTKKEKVTVYDKEITKGEQEEGYVEHHKNIANEHDETIHTREQIKALELFTKIYQLSEESSTTTNITIVNDTDD